MSEVEDKDKPDEIKEVLTRIANKEIGEGRVTDLFLAVSKAYAEGKLLYEYSTPAHQLMLLANPNAPGTKAKAGNRKGKKPAERSRKRKRVDGDDEDSDEIAGGDAADGGDGAGWGDTEEDEEVTVDHPEDARVRSPSTQYWGLRYPESSFREKIMNSRVR
jgi:hypothetical protein